MPLILAIEPNKTQAQQLAALVSQHLDAELVTAASAAAALTALGNRIPDLVLTPALLNLRDEAALTERLRELGAAASHVQTLAVPILAAARGRSVGSLLGRKKEKTASSDDVGCDPSLFADQIRTYLDRAAAERNAAARARAATPASAPPPAASTAMAAQTEQLQSDDDTFNITVIDGSDDAGVLEVLALPEPPVIVKPLPEPPAAKSAAPRREPATPIAEPPAAHPVTASRAAERKAETPPAPARRQPPKPQNRSIEAELGLVPPPTAGPPLWRVTEGLEDFYNGAATFTEPEEPPAPEEEEAIASADEPAAPVEEPVAETSPVSADEDAAEEFVELELDDVMEDAEADMVTDPDGAIVISAAPDALDVGGSIDLTSMISPPRGAASKEPKPRPAAPAVAAPPGDAVASRRPAAPSKPPRPRKASAQDEWTYFDPSQSQFQALARRLDEIAGGQ